MNSNNAKNLPVSPAKEIKSLAIGLLISIVSLTGALIYNELVLHLPPWVSNLLLAVIGGLISGAFVGMVIWIFDKFASAAIHQRAVRRGVIAIIDQSALFMCDLSVWSRMQNKTELQHELQKCLMTEELDTAISFCMQQIEKLKSITITGRNATGLTRYVREHLDFLEKTHNMYDNSFMYYGYCGYLLSQHSELHKILLAFENTVLPSKVSGKNKQGGALTMTKFVVIEKAFRVYLDSLEKFLKEAQTNMEKSQDALQAS